MSKHTVFNLFSGLLSFILLLFVISSVLMFGAKKIFFDYDGKYASNRIVYTDEFGFSLLVTYYTKYQRSEAKGLAIVHIPPEALVKDSSLRAKKKGGNIPDSEEYFASYQAALLPPSMKPDKIPDKGNYYVIEYIDTVKK
ncbi:MAG: hypothetical protein K5930_05275 [Treponemataceae bacterium]|nr:hypothetical protein [Treponemataceae bacterium]